MSNDVLRQRLRDHEDGWTERKTKNIKTEEICEALVAFANSLPEGHEGILFIGVSDKGEPLGVDNTQKMQEKVDDLASRWCYPPVQHTCRVFEESGFQVIAVIVPGSPNRPHFAGPAFIRVGSRSKKASPELLDQLFAYRNSVARVILEERDKGRAVTVDILGRVPRRVTCKVKSCNLHYALFEEVNTSEILSVSLNLVTIGWNDLKNTTMFSFTPIS
jgi:hypothetical protein